MKKLLLSGLKSKNQRVKGAELIIVGGLVLLGNSLSFFVGIAIILYGIYRVFLQKSYPIGTASIILGILILSFSGTLRSMLLVGGLILIIYGMYLLFSPKKDKIEDNTTP
ncbi:MAG: hypothetical protein ACI86H_000144 [bacterium]|jgi:hypothetical protein